MTRRPRGAILPTLVIAAVIVVAFAIFTNIWTERLWYSSFDFGTVFNTMLLTRVGLFLAFGLLMATLVAANAAIAYRMRPKFSGGPTSALLQRSRDVLETRFALIVGAISVVIGLFAGGAAAGEVSTYLAWRNATPFGEKDPIFGLDISFFVFSYPWWRFVISFVFSGFVLSTIAAAVVHYLTGAIRFSGRRGATTAAQAHLSILVGLAVLTKGVSYWFDRYGLEISNTSLLTGINYTAAHAGVTAKLILAVIAVLCSILFFANAVIQRWVVPTIGLTLMVLSAIVLGIVYPGAVQYFSVRPDEPDKERPYIQNNINATRAAYGIDKVEITDYSAKTTATAGQLRSDAEALPGIRLMDPNLLNGTFEQLQQVRGYYSFPKTLDVDRYTIDGQETDAVVAVREMDLSGLPAESQNWNNLKTVYTHGYGLVAAYGNRSQSGGQPDWIAGGIPTSGDLKEVEPRIYFGELMGQRPSEYSIVGAPEGSTAIELDTPSGGDAGNASTYTYSGSGGVPVGSLWHRLLYAAKFADVNILLSDRVNSASKIIYDRTPRERVQKAAPWLTVDGDAYPALVDGRIKWIVDGYTTSNSYPYSQRVALNQVTADSQTQVGGTVVAQPDTNINYMRNSVKAVVDAYDGTVTLYAWDNSDPVLQTWEKVFPGVVQPRSAISPDLLSHLRYPQDMFKVQRQILARYHVTDPGTWYQQSATWQIPNDPVAGPGSTVTEQPYYLSIKWPEDEGAVFSLTTVFVPKGRSNLAAYMAVNADASSPDYGQMRVLKMSDTTQIDGPGQTANAFNTNPTVAEALRPFLNQGSANAQSGNLLTLPVGGGLLYVQPVYTQRQGSSGAYPALQFVLVRFGQQVGIGATLQQALNQVFGGDSGATTGEGDGSGGSGDQGGSGKVDNPAAVKALAEAQTAFANADKALKEGDLAMYATQIKAAQEAVGRLKQALGR
ncbi:UPF0182 family membrane protein [Microlunatus ginsengisoli]|uniref:UPF0182 protein GCM10022236_24130 n=1 Tax=Microlunatus ginsengisoli TaxID=363863 RepID=A0ABP7A109_9ACTN